MSNLTDSDRLVALLQAALTEADTVGSTLVAAMLAECIDVAARDAGPLDDPR